MNSFLHSRSRTNSHSLALSHTLSHTHSLAYTLPFIHSHPTPPSHWTESDIEVDPLVAFQVALLREALPTGHAAVGPLPGVHAPVRLQVAQLGEAAAAQRAAEGPLPRVRLQVGPQVARVGEAPAALAAAMPGALRDRAEAREQAGVLGAGGLVLGFAARRGQAILGVGRELFAAEGGRLCRVWRRSRPERGRGFVVDAGARGERMARDCTGGDGEMGPPDRSVGSDGGLQRETRAHFEMPLGGFLHFGPMGDVAVAGNVQSHLVVLQLTRGERDGRVCCLFAQPRLLLFLVRI